MSKVFSGFLTAVILSLELMNACHGGFRKEFIGKLFHDHTNDRGNRKLNWPVVIVLLLKSDESSRWPSCDRACSSYGLVRHSCAESYIHT